jgi:hypothetical protein
MRRETPEKKRQDEKRLISEMIAYYCQKKHGSAAGLICEDCRKLMEYANTRIERCPFTESKTFCSHCEVHCYAPEMRERIREVMRYSGPRMLIRHPLLSVRHALTGMQNKNTGKKGRGEG